MPAPAAPPASIPVHDFPVHDVAPAAAPAATGGHWTWSRGAADRGRTPVPAPPLLGPGLPPPRAGGAVRYFESLPAWCHHLLDLRDGFVRPPVGRAVGVTVRPSGNWAGVPAPPAGEATGENPVWLDIGATSRGETLLACLDGPGERRPLVALTAEGTCRTVADDVLEELDRLLSGEA